MAKIYRFPKSDMNDYFPMLDNDKAEALHTMLSLILDHVDYTNGNCQPNEQVAACLPLEILERAKKLLVITS